MKTEFLEKQNETESLGSFVSATLISWDLVNATFEAVAAVLAWRAVAALRKVDKPAGVYGPQVAFSCLWGVVSLPYYASHGDYLSLSFAAVRDVANITWCVLLYDRMRRP